MTDEQKYWNWRLTMEIEEHEIKMRIFKGNLERQKSENAIQIEIYSQLTKDMSKDDISEVETVLEMMDEAENLHKMKERY